MEPGDRFYLFIYDNVACEKMKLTWKQRAEGSTMLNFLSQTILSVRKFLNIRYEEINLHKTKRYMLASPAFMGFDLM